MYYPPERRYYYPSKVVEPGATRTKALWYPDRLFQKNRSYENVKSVWRKLELLDSENRLRERSRLITETGIQGIARVFSASLLVEPYCSFPIDVMHLLCWSLPKYMFELLSRDPTEAFHVIEMKQVGIDMTLSR